jgi:hypothetical protein
MPLADPIAMQRRREKSRGFNWKFPVNDKIFLSFLTYI